MSENASNNSSVPKSADVPPAAPRPPRDRSLDVFKGLLVIGMVYCHVLQFFGDTVLFPVIWTIQDVINVTVFPCFVFAFGAAFSLAYFRKPFSNVWYRMLISAMRALLAFYLSGIAFLVLRENKPFAAGTIWKVLVLESIPGWSEFLVAFALYGIAAIIFFYPLKKMRNSTVAALIASTVCLLGCFLPYDRITSPYLGLVAGTRNYVTFPVLQYAPYFLMGIVFPNRNKKYTWAWGVGALALSAVGLFTAVGRGGMPERFPPEISWIILPAAGLALLMLVSWLLCKIPSVDLTGLLGRLRGKDASASMCVDIISPLESMGRNSLYYLLFSNIAIFTFAGKNIVPLLKAKSGGIWGQPIQSPFGAFCWTLALLLVCAFTASLSRAGVRKSIKSDTNPSTQK